MAKYRWALVTIWNAYGVIIMESVIKADGYLKIISNSQYQSQKILESLKVFLKDILIKKATINKIDYSKEDESILIAYVSGDSSTSFTDFVNLILGIQNIPLNGDEERDAFEDLIVPEYTIQVKVLEVFAGILQTYIDIVLHHQAYTPLDSIRIVMDNAYSVTEKEEH